MQIAGCVAFARASMHSERVLYRVPWPPSDVTKQNVTVPPAAGGPEDAGAASSTSTQFCRMEYEADPPKLAMRSQRSRTDAGIEDQRFWRASAALCSMFRQVP